MKNPKYLRQEDPTDPSVPLAWVFKKDERRLGDLPHYQCGHYKQVVIGRKTWFVHCSFAGALDLVFQALGEGNVRIDEQSGTGELNVPESMIGSWIGAQGSVMIFLKEMFGLGYLRIVGDPNWEHS